MGCADEQASNQHSFLSKEPIHGGEIVGETSSSGVETPISGGVGGRLRRDLLVLQEPANADEIDDECGPAEREEPSRACSFAKL